MSAFVRFKQSIVRVMSEWGIGKFMSDGFSDLIPTDGLEYKIDTSIGVHAQYEDIHQILGDLKRTILLVETITYGGLQWEDHIDALKKIGPTVIDQSNRNEDAEPELIDMERLPALIFMATRTQERHLSRVKRNEAVPVFMYGIKLIDPAANKDPNAELYAVGEYYRWKKGGFWTSFYVTVKDGRLHCPRTIQGKRQYWLEEFARIYNYTYESGVKCSEKVCAIYFNIWQRRDLYWRFSAHTPEARVTFLINPSDPKRIFADREVKVRTPTGQKKKIIHYVSGHDRITKKKKIWIKPHLRGLRTFYWGGAYCSVLAPKHHKINIDDWQAAGVDQDDHPERKLVEMKDFIGTIVGGENSQDTNAMMASWERRKGGKVYRKLKRQKLRDKMRL